MSRKRQPVYNKNGIIGMIAVIFLRYHNQRMNLPQKLISVLLYVGHSEKMVSFKIVFFIFLLLIVVHGYTSESVVLVTQSHMSYIEHLGEQHDADILEWKNQH